MTDTPRSKIPTFTSVQEEADFWDTHDITDFADELKPVYVHFFKNLSEGITVRFDTKTLQILRAVASEKGIDATTLVRTWVMEKLNDQPAQKL